MTGHGPLQHANRQGRTGSFAQAQAQRQKRRLAQFRQQPPVRHLGRQVTRNGVIQRAGHGLFQRRRRRTADETVKDNRNAVMVRCCDRTGHRREFTPPQTPQGVQGIRGQVQRQPLGHHLCLAGQPGVIHAGAAPRPSSGITAQNGSGDGGSAVVLPMPISPVTTKVSLGSTASHPVASATTTSASVMAGPWVKSAVGVSRSSA